MGKHKTSIWANGATTRLHNKQIDFVEHSKKDGIVIQFKFAEDNAEKPAVKHFSLKGKVRVSQIALSHEAMRSLCYSYLKYIQNKELTDK